MEEILYWAVPSTPTPRATHNDDRLALTKNLVLATDIGNENGHHRVKFRVSRAKFLFDF
jgi:hypothetical protein